MTLDNRDPQAVGEALEGLKREYPKLKPSVRANMLGHLAIKAYDGSETSVTTTVATRQEELRDRAARGDRFAIALLNGESLAEDPVD